MAAPCVKFLRRVGVKCFSKTNFSGLSFPRLHPNCIRRYVAPPNQSATLLSESQAPKWELYSAVCLERYPVVSQNLRGIESEYKSLLDTVEFENSVMSEHELQVIEDKEKILRRQRGEDDIDDENRELITALDLEDQYTEEFNKFEPANRSSDIDDIHSLQRKLMDKLVLLVKCRVGDRSHWMMPQGTRQDGESMRTVAERILVSQCGLHEIWRARIFGNAPSACYKYIYPPQVREENEFKGAKIFFYKARLLSGDIAINTSLVEDHAWVTHSEMDKYLIPSYLDTVRKFIVPINTVEL